jgi:uncharacterized protein YjlB
MAVLEELKKSTERVTGWQRPAAERVPALIRNTKPATFLFRDDGAIPNHPRWPVLVYWRAMRLPSDLDPAAVLEDIFERNGWDDSWRDGIYNYLHFHSRIHEVLGVARGSAQVRLGGDHGRTFKLSAGDVAVLPAGTGHQCLSATSDFLVVGAYPPSGTYDECHATAQDYTRAKTSLPKVGRPRKDPLSGSDGPLLQIWKTKS